MQPEARLIRCRWPELAAPYVTALREAVAYIFARWEPVGIVAAGTIVRGTPSPTSDLDLQVLHTEPTRQRVQRRFRGVPAEIFVNPPARIAGYFEAERRDGRPRTAHMFATGFVIFDADACVEALRERAVAVLGTPPDPSPEFLVRYRYAVATGLEDAEDVASADPDLCAALLHRAVESAIEYRFWVGHRWQPRPKDTLAALGTLDAPLAAAVRAFYRAADLRERGRLAREIVGRTSGATGFFEWESPVEPLPAAAGGAMPTATPDPAPLAAPEPATPPGARAQGATG